MKNITEEMLSSLRISVKELMSEKRYKHTLAVEKMADKISLLYCKEYRNILRAAALLHDITKELPKESQIEICEKYGVEYDSDNLAAKKTFHAMTAAALIKEKYPEFYSDEVYLAVRYHTTGRNDMTLFEKIIYLADYIDETRTYDECVYLRNLFFSLDIESLSEEERLIHLDKVVLESLNITIKDLIAENKVINKDTVAARNCILKNLNL